MKWYKRDPDAALNGFRGLTHEEKSCYGTLIDYYYARDGHVPDDDWLLSRQMECNPRTWRKVKIALFEKQKITLNSLGNLVPNRGEETLNEARSFSERQANRSRKRWESKEKSKINNGSSKRRRNPNTTTTTSTPLTPNLNFKDKGVDYRASLELQLAQKRHLGISPDKGMDYRSEPRTKSDNKLMPLPDEQTSQSKTRERPIDNKSSDQNPPHEVAAKPATNKE